MYYDKLINSNRCVILNTTEFIYPQRVHVNCPCHYSRGVVEPVWPGVYNLCVKIMTGSGESEPFVKMTTILLNCLLELSAYLSDLHFLQYILATFLTLFLQWLLILEPFCSMHLWFAVEYWSKGEHWKGWSAWHQILGTHILVTNSRPNYSIQMVF